MTGADDYLGDSSICPRCNVTYELEPWEIMDRCVISLPFTPDPDYIREFCPECFSQYTRLLRNIERLIRIIR